ncbi:hypothetical protein P7K49_002332 [Saguinus oedipus]|uniref:Uncharacterized protein n=1 Tax=Saguinus oedipus TaxID=9490 RepID=A0ABQ9WH16_SAGOE|nr:hypothetical protein P7K49_002332 [Saguinus oedipus]
MHAGVGGEAPSQRTHRSRVSRPPQTLELHKLTGRTDESTEIHGQVYDPLLQGQDEPRRRQYSDIGRGLLHFPVTMKDTEQEDDILCDEDGVLLQVGQWRIPIVTLVQEKHQEPGERRARVHTAAPKCSHRGLAGTRNTGQFAESSKWLCGLPSVKEGGPPAPEVNSGG